jgi:DNA-binding transcriptional regulator YiaG
MKSPNKPQSPTPAEILALRKAAGLTQEQAAYRVYASSYRTWQDWERGVRTMPATALALWEAQDKICDLERRLERAEHLQDR